MRLFFYLQDCYGELIYLLVADFAVALQYVQIVVYDELIHLLICVCIKHVERLQVYSSGPNLLNILQFIIRLS